MSQCCRTQLPITSRIQHISAGYWGSRKLEPSQTCGHLPVNPPLGWSGAEPDSAGNSPLAINSEEQPQRRIYVPWMVPTANSALPATAGARRPISQNALKEKYGTNDESKKGRCTAPYSEAPMSSSPPRPWVPSGHPHPGSGLCLLFSSLACPAPCQTLSGCLLCGNTTMSFWPTLTCQQ